MSLVTLPDGSVVRTENVIYAASQEWQKATESGVSPFWVTRWRIEVSMTTGKIFLNFPEIEADKVLAKQRMAEVREVLLAAKKPRANVKKGD